MFDLVTEFILEQSMFFYFYIFACTRNKKHNNIIATKKTVTNSNTHMLIHVVKEVTYS